MTDFDAIRNRIREAHLEALRQLDEAEAAETRTLDAHLAIPRAASMAMPSLEDALSVLLAIAPAFAAQTHYISLGVVDPELWRAFTALDGVSVTTTYYSKAPEDYVIVGATVQAGALTIQCQADSRPPTAEERRQYEAAEKHHQETAYTSARVNH